MRQNFTRVCSVGLKLGWAWSVPSEAAGRPGARPGGASAAKELLGRPLAVHRSFPFFILLLGLLVRLPLGAAEPGDAVTLPPYIVEEASKGPPWRYAELPGFEILSRCSDRTTRELVEMHVRLHRLLELLLPERLQLSFTVPRTLIFYDEALQSAASREVIASMMKTARKGAPPSADPIGGDFGPLGRRATLLPTPFVRVSFLPNLRLWDKDAMTVFSIVRDGGYDPDRLVLTRDYLQYLLLNRAPALPWWFVSGVLALYNHTEYNADSLSLGPITWISETVTDALKDNPKNAPAPLPLAEFFSGAPPVGTPEGEARRKIWIAQGALVVRWALDGRTPAQRAAFVEFVDRAVHHVTSEEFQRGFGVDFATADAQLAAYLPAAVRKTVTLRPARPWKAPVVTLRNANEAELARIKGDWERLEVGFVRQQTPELAGKYLEQARRTLRHAYDREVRDPRLLATMGLCECDAGDDAAAREFLESAARLGPLRPRAGYELARLRFAEADAHPEGAAGRISATQVAQVFTPLFAVREQAPAIPEIYELIAQVWSRSAFQPTRAHLDVLEDGVRLFPRRGSLIYRTALLYAERGFPLEAIELVRLGLVVTTDAAERDRFTQLAARLGATDPAK